MTKGVWFITNWWTQSCSWWPHGRVGRGHVLVGLRTVPKVTSWEWPEEPSSLGRRSDAVKRFAWIICGITKFIMLRTEGGATEGKVLARGSLKWRARSSVSVFRNQFEILSLCGQFCCRGRCLAFVFNWWINLIELNGFRFASFSSVGVLPNGCHTHTYIYWGIYTIGIYIYTHLALTKPFSFVLVLAI